MCGSGKTAAHVILKDDEYATTDDHNADPNISAVCFADKKKASTEEEKSRAGDEGAFKLELIKWLMIYDQILDKLEGVNFVNLKQSKQQELVEVYSMRGAITLVAHTFARQARGEIAFPKEIGKWMLQLLDSEAVPWPTLFGYISPNYVQINQNRILQRQAERNLDHTLRWQDTDDISEVFTNVNKTTLYKKEDQLIHTAVLELLAEMMHEKGFYPIVLDSGNVSSKLIARGAFISSEILLNPENSTIVGKVFRDFLEKVANGEINVASVQERLKQTENQEIVEECSALEYFEKHHTNDYDFDWLEFENAELSSESTEYKERFPQQYELFEQQIMGGLDVVIPYRDGSNKNLNQTLENLTESFNHLLLYLPKEKRSVVKLNIIIVDQESAKPPIVEDNKQSKGNIRTRVVQAKKHPKYDFDVDACRAEGVKYTELQNTLFLDHEVFLHLETLVRFYKTIAKTKSAKGLEAIACCSSTVDKVTQNQLGIVLGSQRSGKGIEITPDWTADILKQTNYLRKLGGLWKDEHGLRPVYGFLRPGIHLVPTAVSRYAFETTLPMGGYGKEQLKYLETFIKLNGNIFIIMDPNEKTRVYTIKGYGLEGHQKSPTKQQGLDENAEFEKQVLENTQVQLLSKPDGNFEFQIVEKN